MNCNLISVNNIEIIGGLDLSFKHPFWWPVSHSPIYSIMEPSLIENEKNKFEKYEFKTGYLNEKNKFYYVPLKIGYILIESIYVKEEYHKYDPSDYSISFKFDLYSKDYKEKIDISIEKKQHQFDLKYIQNTINYLNLYIQSDNNINELDIEKLLKEDYYLKDISWYINIINNLEFKFQELWIQEVHGKDEISWFDYQFINLPENRYVASLIKDRIDFDHHNYIYPEGLLNENVDEDSKWFINKSESYRLRGILYNLTVYEFDPINELFGRIKINPFKKKSK